MIRMRNSLPIFGVILLALFTADCKKKKDALPFLMFGAQQATNPVDVNGNPLPNNEGNGEQEVATSGPALITGSVIALDGASPAPDFDYESVEVQLVAPDGTVVATTNLTSDGEYSFSLDDLENNNYRVVIPEGQGLEGAHIDFNFVFDPTSNPTVKNLADMNAQVTTFPGGPAILTGSVESPGYDDGNITVGAGPLAGITVDLMNQNGDIVASTTTDGQGNFNFDLQDSNEWLSNGSYVVVARGSEASAQGRNYTDAATGVDFVFQGNVQNQATSISVGKISSAWDAAESAVADISGTIQNLALAGVDMSGLTVELLGPNGNVLETTSTDSSGAFSLSETLNNGVYSIRVTGEGYNSLSQSLGFTANADGSTTSVNLGNLGIRPRDSLITGNITEQATGSPIDDAVISFRPAQDQPVEKLAYLLDDPDLGGAVQRWIQEKQTTGSYQTYLTKSYEDRGDHLELTAVPGKWRFYVSAAGFSPSSDANAADSGSNVVTVNGSNVNRSVALFSNTNRSRIRGTALTLDTLVDGSKNAYPGGVPGYTARGHGLPGMVVVMLNNANQSGAPVAHVALTAADGTFSLGPQHVVLSGQATSDAERVAEAVAKYRNGQVTTSGLGSGSWSNDSVYSDGTGHYFRTNSYSIYIVDPLQHMSASLTTANVSSVAQNSPGATLNLSAVVPHLPRKQITGSVSNAISTVDLSGATVELLNRADRSVVYRDRDIIPAKNRLADATAHMSVDPVSTDSDGGFAFRNIDPGNYILKVTAPGYVNTEVEVNVPADGSNPVVSIPVVPDGDPGNVTGKIQLPGGHDFTEPYSLEVVHPVSGNRPTAGVQPSSLTSGPTQFNNSPRYTIFGLKPGQWRIRFVSAGYKTVEGVVTVQSNVTTTFDIITFVPGSHGPAPVSGTVRNALNNRPVSGLQVRIRPGVGIQSGDYATYISGNALPAVHTSDSGTYVIPDVPAGNYTLEVSGAGYSTTYRTVISAGTDTPANQDVLISPQLADDEVRIVLSWNQHPQDLDSHLEYGFSHPAQVVWNDKSHLNGDLILDYDVVTGFGPETVTVKGDAWSQPRLAYSVFNWTRYATPYWYSVLPIADSGATVRIYKSTGLVRSFHAGPGEVGKWWHLFCLSPQGAVLDAGQAGCSDGDYFDAPYN